MDINARRPSKAAPRNSAFVTILALLTCLSSLAPAIAAERYRVTLTSYPGYDAGPAAKRLAAAYQGQLETAVAEDGTFAITLSAATAHLLARDPQVAQVRRIDTAAAAPVAPAVATSWNLGSYRYDDAGNISQIGSTVFVYDTEGRLSYEKDGTQTRQSVTYDGFGNIRSVTTAGHTYTIGSSSSSNRADISSASVSHLDGTYDPAGNMITFETNTYTYDALNVMTRSTTDVARAYVYNANDERVGTITLSGPAGTEVSSAWTLRGSDGQVLRRFGKQGSSWRWMQDYIYRDGRMLASESNDQIKTLHYHLDHLGTPRLITGNGGVEVARHTYYPFGEEVPGSTPQVAESKKFTGHERDGGGLDYMLARFYSPSAGRFLTVDPIMNIEPAMKKPQGWNRYAYVRNNPLSFTDPTGMVENPSVSGGVIVNRSDQDVYIAFDATSLVAGQNNADVIIPLRPGESSNRFTSDADAVIVGEGQTISGAMQGAFKIGVSSVEVKNGQNGGLVLVTGAAYQTQARAGAAGYQPNPPTQWQMQATQTPGEQEKARQELAATRDERERIVVRQQQASGREKIRDFVRLWLGF